MATDVGWSSSLSYPWNSVAQLIFWLRCSDHISDAMSVFNGYWLWVPARIVSRSPCRLIRLCMLMLPCTFGNSRAPLTCHLDEDFNPTPPIVLFVPAVRLPTVVRRTFYWIYSCCWCMYIERFTFGPAGADTWFAKEEGGGWITASTESEFIMGSKGGAPSGVQARGRVPWSLR